MSHEHEHVTSGGRLAVVVALNFLITGVELAGGLISGSLSLLSDALHNFSDGVAVIIAWLAIRLKHSPHTPRYTFGFRRAQILAAVINAGTLVAISLYLFVASYHRFVDPQPVAGGVMTVVAGVGLAANALGTWLLHGGAKGDMNIRAAYLHLLSDAVSSVAVILGGLAIAFWGVYWVDPLLTVLIALYVLKESLGILWRAVSVLMMAVPPGLSPEAIRAALEALPGVRGVHHQHLWQLDEHQMHFEAHVEVADMPLSETGVIRQALEDTLRERFHIGHTTLQFEHQGLNCGTRDVP